MPDGKPYDRNDFIKTFNNIARHRHRYEVFRDFVTMSAISLHNAVNKNDEMEEEQASRTNLMSTKETTG